jgi:replicative DNA helicase
VSNTGNKVPPQDLEAERSLLAGLLLDSAALPKIVDLGLEPEDFYREANGKIFASILALSSRGEPIDLVTLSAQLRKAGDYDFIGGSAYLTGLFESAYTSAHVAHYAKIVKDNSTLRKIISTSNDLIDTAYGGVEQIEEFLDNCEKSIFEVTNSKSRPVAASIRDVLIENMSRIQELSEKNSMVTGLATGFMDFDRMTSGLQPGQLVIIAARPAMGKTSLALNIAQNAAIDSKASVAVFSLEMAKEELVFRLLTSLARVDAASLKVGRLKDRDWKALTKAANTLSETKIFIDDSAAISVLEMRSRCRRVQAEHGLNLVIVDYLQLMRGTSKPGKGSDNREREIAEISRGLKSLAKELRVPVIALSQLNRGVEARADKRPMMSDLRESGAIEQDADIVSFVYRDEVYNKESEDKGKAEFIIAKHRSGSTGTIRLNWDAQYTSFSNEDDSPSVGYGVSPTGLTDQGVGAPSPRPQGNHPQRPKSPLDLPEF